MSDTQQPSRVLRSIGAVLAGMIVGIALTLGTDELLHLTHVFPPWGDSMAGYDGALLLATVYRTVYGIAASYITAKLAPHRPLLHAMVGGVLGLLVSIVGAVATWNKEPAFGPLVSACARRPCVTISLGRRQTPPGANERGSTALRSLTRLSLRPRRKSEGAACD
jgi:hypothetical protein